MNAKNYYIIIFIFIVASLNATAESVDLGFNITPEFKLQKTSNEVFEPIQLKTFKDSLENIFKIMQFTDCDHQCSEMKLKIYKDELLLVDQEVRDPYYGKIAKDFTNCVDNKEIEKIDLNLKTSLILFSNKNYVLGKCKKEERPLQVKLTFLYCEKQKTLWLIKHFSKIKNKLSSNYSCR